MATTDIKLYHTGSVLSAPSPSSFVLKLMTYFRMANIKHETIETFKASSKGKIPYITYKGKEMADSTLIIDFINKELKIDLNSTLNICDKAVALSFQRLCEENLYWVLVYNRWFVDQDKFFQEFPMTGLKRSALKVYANLTFKRAAKANLSGHGIGRHSKKEVYAIAEKDIAALSAFLGEKPFFMGDEPTEVDCSLFGLLAQFAYVLIGSEQENLVIEKHQNLKAYCDRMKEKYWPDWDDHCAK